MLESIFSSLFKEGVLLFLKPENYIENTAPLNILSSRSSVLKCLGTDIQVGYVYIKTPLEEIKEVLNVDGSIKVVYGFDSVNDNKSNLTADIFINVLKKHGVNTLLPSLVKNRREIGFVIAEKDLP